jgi:hypothetical protein
MNPDQIQNWSVDLVLAHSMLLKIVQCDWIASYVEWLVTITCVGPVPLRIGEACNASKLFTPVPRILTSQGMKIQQVHD